MTLDGRKLKETGVRLLLSSRAEMQKVIEMARQQTVSVFQLNTPPVVQAPPPIIPNPQVLLAQQMIRHQMPFNPNMGPLGVGVGVGVAPPRLNFPLQQMLQPPPQMLQMDRNVNVNDKKPVGRDRRRDSRSRSRERRRSRSRDRSTSRDKTRRNRSRSRSRDRTSSHRRRRRSYSRDYDSDESDSRSSKRKSVTPPKSKEPVQIWENQAPFNFRAVYNNNSNDSGTSRGNGRTTAPAPPVLDKHAFGEFQRLRDRRNEPQRPPENSNDNAIDLTEDDHNCCVQVTNIEKTTGYKDLRRFFQGLPVRQNGLKMINDEQGRRSGVAFVRFHRPESRKFALMRSGHVLNGNKLVVSTLDDNQFEEAIDSFRPPPNGTTGTQLQELRTKLSSPTAVVSPAAQSLLFDKIVFTCLKVTDLPSLTTEQDIMKHFSEYGLMHIILTKDRQKRHCAFLKLNRAEDAKRALQEKNVFSMGHNKKITVTMCSEAVFEEVMNSIMTEEVAPTEETEKTRAEETATITEDKSSTRPKAASSRWGEKVDELILSPAGSITTDNGTRNSSSRWSTDEQQTHTTPALNPILSQLNLSLPFLNSLLPQAAAALARTDMNVKQQLPQQQQIPPQQQAPVQAVSRDPRLKNAPNNSSTPNQRLSDPRSTNFNPNSRPGDSDCVVVSNLEPSCSDLDVASFFSKAGIVPMRVHILLNTSGGPSGDAFVEFSSTKDADLALLQNERLLGKNPVFVETIPREQVNEVLSSFGGDGGNRRSNGGGSAGQPSSIYNQFAATGFDPMMRGRGQGMPQQRPPFMPPEQAARKGDTNVLMLNNVPYRAGVEDIIDFFAGYDIRPQDVMRRFNDNGQATAEAKVRFKNPAEANKAYDEKKFGKMANRTIFLDFDH